MAPNQADGKPPDRVSDLPITAMVGREPSAKHLQEIGRIIIAWTWLESSVANAIEAFGGLDDTSADCILTHITMPLRLDILLSLARLRLKDQAEMDRLTRIVGRIREAMGQRNEVAHTLWVTDIIKSPDPKSTKASKLYLPVGLITKSRGKLKYVHKRPVEFDFEAVYNNIAALTWELTSFVVVNVFLDKHGDEHPAS